MVTKPSGKYPVILIPDKSKARPHVAKIKEETKLDASLYDPKPGYGSPIFPNHRQSHATLQRLLNANPEFAKQLDLRILLLLTSKLEKSKVRELPESEQHYLRQIAHELIISGCRAKFKTQEQLANELGISRQSVNEKFKTMRELMIIVDQRNGWVDLNPNIFWLGKMEHQIAYCDTYCRLEFADDGQPQISCRYDSSKKEDIIWVDD